MLGGNLNFERIIGSSSLQFSESKNHHPFQFFWKIFRTDELSGSEYLKNRYGFHERLGKEPVLSLANSLIF